MQNKTKASNLKSKALLQNKSKFLPKVLKSNCLIVQNKYQIAPRSCFVPATIIRDEVDIKGKKHVTKFGKTNLTHPSKK